MAESNVTAERVRELFDYDPETGVLTRKACAANHWRATPIVRSYDTRGRGYLKAKVDRKTYFVHRLVWLHVHGHWPAQEIDHIDRDAGNNRISNLRDVPRVVNIHNRSNMDRPPKRYRRARGEREPAPKREGWVEKTISKRHPYRARAWMDGKKVGLGNFLTAEAAWAAIAARTQSTGQLTAVA